MHNTRETNHCENCIGVKAMSLLCDETGMPIPFGDELFAALHPDGSHFFALSGVVVARIRESERHPNSATPGTGAIDIYDGLSVRNEPMETYSLLDFRLGEFLFSISEETAQRVLPRHLARLA